MEKSWPWTRWLMLLYMIGQSMVGVAGIFDPSPSLDRLDLVDLYSVLSVVFAVLGFVGVVRGRAEVMMWSVYGMALEAMVHGASIMLLPTGSLQTGFRLMITPLMMVPLGHIWWKYNVLETVLNRKE